MIKNIKHYLAGAKKMSRTEGSGDKSTGLNKKFPKLTLLPFIQHPAEEENSKTPERMETKKAKNTKTLLGRSKNDGQDRRKWRKTYRT